MNEKTSETSRESFSKNSNSEMFIDKSVSEYTDSENIHLTDKHNTREMPKAFEIRNARNEKQKVYRMNNGDTRVEYNFDGVCVFDEATNEYIEINNYLVKDKDEKYLRNIAGRYLVKFNTDSDEEEIFALEKGIYRVIVSSKKSNPNKKGVVRLKGLPESNTIDGTRNSLIYESIESGVDLEYSVNSNGVKENIIINKKSSNYDYHFDINCENVVAKYDELKKRVSFYCEDTNEEVFYIPAPFMVDAANVMSHSVHYECKKLDNNTIRMSIVADANWINSDERTFPICIDPQICVSGDTDMKTFSYENGSLTEANFNAVGVSSDKVCRMYVNMNIPELPVNSRIKKAELTFYQYISQSVGGSSSKIGLYHIPEDIALDSTVPEYDANLIDYSIEKSGYGSGIKYCFDITALLDKSKDSSSLNLVLKMISESTTSGNLITLYGEGTGSTSPQLNITYESSYSVNSSYRTNNHKLGCFGQGSIDLACGNLMYESVDFAWSGNRMPVTIKHLYNSALSNYQYTTNNTIQLECADYSAIKLGYGWKLNLMQSMMPTSFVHDGTQYTGYVYVDENGNDIYFKPKSAVTCTSGTTVCYYLYEDVNGNEMIYDPEHCTLTQGDEIYLFDTSGRLISITDKYNNQLSITYNSNRIESVSDGIGRSFSFNYNSNGFLSSITAPDNTSITYTYNNNLLESITYPDGRRAVIAYNSSKPESIILKDSDGNSTYKVCYEFNGNKVVSVKEYGCVNGSFTEGASSEYSYSAASRRTIVQTTEKADTTEGETEDNIIKTVYTFDDDGNVISEYVYTEDTGNVASDSGASGINPYARDGGAGVVSNINNLLAGHNFRDLTLWTGMSGNSSFSSDLCGMSSYQKFGANVLRMESGDSSCVDNGIYQTTITLPAGPYTFSAYCRVFTAFTGSENTGAYIRVTDASGNTLAESERISAIDSDYVRLIAPFDLATEQVVNVHLLVTGMGGVCFTAPQLENNPYANAYNMLENGNFERGMDRWSGSRAACSDAFYFNMGHSLTMPGYLESKIVVYQDVYVKTGAGTRETFTLSGWAKGYGIPNHERENANLPTFRLRADIKYSGSSEYETGHYAEFSPCTDEWQLASIQFTKNEYKSIEHIRVCCDYDYNYGTVYFDDIQLVRDSIETGLSASDFTGNVDEDVIDDTDSTETIDSPEFEEAIDAYGNTLTETTFTDGEFGTIYRSFGYSSNGNDLIRETDARGEETTYTVDAETSRHEEITDRCGNKTAYEYDAAGRTTKVTSKNSSGAELANVSYAYDTFDNMTSITRGDGMKYTLNYNAYHNLESIGINGKTENLVAYTYKNGNGRLKEITYANGEKMKATYNSIGQLVTEKWYNSANTLVAHYKYVYDGQGNIVRSIDIKNNKEYNYVYEEGRIVRSSECDVTLDANEFVTAKTLVNSVIYVYNSDGELKQKRIIPANGDEFVVYYDNTDDTTVVKFYADGKTITSHSKTDSFGRKEFDELQLGTGFVSRQFSYYTGEVTEEHKANEKLKSSATTQLVSRITLSDGRTISYEYDAEERITKVTDNVNGVTEYTYDALGQLLTEKHDGTVVNTMTYDNYGNIVSKNGVTYTYGDSVWRDKLTKYGSATIAYDAQGNPTTYFGYTLTWEKGRQLKSLGSNTYTYNANGIRTSKTINGVTHTYELDGTKIHREVWGNNTLVPLYDNEDSVCGILYNNMPFYFLKNLQGDVIAIVNKDAETVARYTYDAWGVCTVKSDTSGCNIATINPYRYRSYYYDAEIGLYYVSSRYYDPEIGRFISADEPMLLAFGGGKFGHNLFSYCENNPINQKDTNGYIAANIVGAAIGAIIGVVGGVFLGNWLADVLKLSGWKRGIFVAAVAALVGAAAGAIGYFIGPYVAKIATKLGHYVLDLLKKGKIAFRKLSNSVKSSIRALGKCACFVAGTLVLTEKGLVPIEEIVPGDKVWSENTSTGETGYKGVVKTFVNQVNTLVKLKFAEEEIKTTMNHPFWVVGSGWKSASKLQSGDKVKRDDGTMVDVLGVEIVYLDTPVNVYNFEVADWHTYFVGNTSILVHNMCAKEFVRSPKNAKQVLKYLKEQGFTVASKKGSHIKLTDGLKTVIVPDHGAKNIAIGTLRSIMKQAGLL